MKSMIGEANFHALLTRPQIQKQVLRFVLKSGLILATTHDIFKLGQQFRIWHSVVRILIVGGVQNSSCNLESCCVQIRMEDARHKQ